MSTRSVLFIAISMGLAGCGSLNFTSISQKKTEYCGDQKLNQAFIMSLSRGDYYSNSSNFLKSFAPQTMNFLTSSNKASAALGLLPPMIVAIVLILGFLATLITFLVFLCPDKFVTRKEYLSLIKQRLFFWGTLLLIVCLLAGFVFFYISMEDNVSSARYAACFYYFVQQELVTGVTEGDYSFVGLDQLTNNVKIFNTEIVNFGSLLSSFKAIQEYDFSSVQFSALKAANNFTLIMAEESFTDPDNVSRLPVWFSSLTDFINDDVYAEFVNIQKVCAGVTAAVGYGTNIIQNYNDSTDVLVISLTSVMNYIFNLFDKVVGKVVSLDQPVEQVLNYIDKFFYLFLVIVICLVIFAPFFVAFYVLRNSSDKFGWMVPSVKMALVGLGVVGIVFSIFFSVFLVFALINASACFYMNALISDPSYYVNNKASFNVEDSDVKTFMTNCFDPKLADFNLLFSSNENTTANIDYTEYGSIRTRPKSNSTEANSTGSDTSGPDPTIITVLPSLPSEFNLQILADFQSFVNGVNDYFNFYDQSASVLSPSVEVAIGDLLDFKNGLSYSFLSYDYYVRQVNGYLECANYAISINAKNCSSTVTKCFVVLSTPASDFATQLLYQPCVINREDAVRIFVNLKNSTSAGATYYAKAQKLLNGTQDQVGWASPGLAASKVRSDLFSIQTQMNQITSTLSGSFNIINSYSGSLSGFVNCYIARRQLTVLEPSVCFIMQGKFFNLMLLVLLMNVLYLLVLWGVFFSIKYSGNLTMGSFVSKSTMNSMIDKSQVMPLSFVQQSEIVVGEESQVELDEKGMYFNLKNKVNSDSEGDEFDE